MGAMYARTTFLLLAAAWLLLDTASVARAFYVEARALEGEEPLVLRYDLASPVEYRIHRPSLPGDFPGNASQAIERAFQTWQDVSCSSLTFTRGEDDRSDVPDSFHWMSDAEGERYILVYFDSDPTHWTGPSVGFFQFGHDGLGNMIGGSIILNSAHHMWTDGCEDGHLDLQSIVTALLGRVLGISSLTPEAAVYARYRPADMRKRTLVQDEIDALQYLYGDGTCTPPEPEQICTKALDEIPECPPAAEADLPEPVCEGDPPMRVDAGPGGRDGGPGGSDAGPGGGDAGPGGGGGDGDGCGCSAPGSDRTGGVALLALGVALALTRRRRG